MVIDTKKYFEINNSFSQKLVYHLGSEAGFFSEYNNMILAMLYCLKHKIKFILYSKDANFGFEKGWQDYFLPFCEETSNTGHSAYNERQSNNQHPFNYKLKRSLFKLKTGTNYLTSDLWDKFHNKKFENEYFNIPLLEINGNILQACAKLIQLTWHYKTETEIEINELIKSLNIPTNYIGLHIRCGDKINESEKIEVDRYFDIVKQNSDLKDVFVLTDDYRVLIELKIKYPSWNFYSFCEENERGYFHAAFSKSKNENIKKKLLKLFISIDLLSRSEHFIGTYSSNPGMYLGMRMNKDKMHGVDIEHWTIW